MAGLVSKPGVRYLIMAALWWFCSLIGPFSCWTKLISKPEAPSYPNEFNSYWLGVRIGVSCWNVLPQEALHPRPHGLTHSLSCNSLGDCDPVLQVLKILLAYLQFGTAANLKSNVRLWAGAEFCKCSVLSFVREKKRLTENLGRYIIHLHSLLPRR